MWADYGIWLLADKRRGCEKHFASLGADRPLSRVDSVESGHPPPQRKTQHGGAIKDVVQKILFCQYWYYCIDCIDICHLINLLKMHFHPGPALIICGCRQNDGLIVIEGK